MQYLMLDHSDGSLKWFLKLSIVGYCSMAFEKYPLDDQHCLMSIASLAHKVESLRFNLTSMVDWTSDEKQAVHQVKYVMYLFPESN